ncbi:MAG: Gfo/Idh/MocA family oxidoreductase [Calditrichae bacterium]|nr:Gfo/Idh/MocA family oxidoreductase [Calditrichota bacterium]MCB9058559.1 Gfo/Idh/MocA family oxidoreductase [Calditrichia bacterium]
MNRRKFIKSSASAALFSIVPRFVLGGTGYTPPSDQLTKAVIGVGGMGRWHVKYAPGKLLAVCDVDKNHLRSAMELGGTDVAGYSDYRDLLDRKDIDIVHIATPPHWHGLIAIDAALAGKDIWCEKPMTRTIAEGQKLVQTIANHGNIFRINTWFRFDSTFYGFGTPAKPIKKIVQNGLLGWPLKVRINAKTGFAWKFYWSGKTNLQPEWIPEELDYDFWLGPAPFKPYHHHRVHGSFRGYWDYDGGGLGDMGQHYLDPVQYILNKDNTSPVEIEADAPQVHPDAVGKWRRIRMKYADGCEILLEGEGYEQDGPFIEGPEGKLFKNLESDIPNLEKKLQQLPDPAPQITDFHEAVRNRSKFALNEVNGHRSATLVNLGKIAIRLGRKLTFDPDLQRFINDDGANLLIDQPMRAPWHL